MVIGTWQQGVHARGAWAILGASAWTMTSAESIRRALHLCDPTVEPLLGARDAVPLLGEHTVDPLIPGRGVVPYCSA